MAMTRLDPTEELRPLPAGPVAESSPAPAAPQTEGPLAYDVYRNDDALCLDFDVPGVDPAGIQLSIEGQILTVAFERELAGAGVEVIERGRVHGCFRRRLMLPAAWQGERLRARYENGVLHLEAPLRRPPAPRAIEITAPAQPAAASAASASFVADGLDDAERSALDPVA